MSLERIPIISKKAIFTVEENPDSTGICFIHKHRGRKRVLAMLIDQGDYFDFVTMDHKGIDVTSFNPETVLLIKETGFPASVESENQMEIDTPFGRKIIVRHLCENERPAGVIVACREGDFLISVLVCGSKDDSLCFMLAK